MNYPYKQRKHDQAEALGVLGVGRMGSRIAEALAQAGLLAAVGDLVADRGHTIGDRQGVPVAPTARELASRPEVGLVLSSLTDPLAVRLAYDGDTGLPAGLSSGMTVVEMSTLDPAQVTRLAAQVEQTGGRLLAAPVSGSPAAVAARQVMIMTSGPDRALARARPALQSIGWLGPHLGEDPGVAMVAKLTINSALYALYAGVVEAVEVAERAGIPRRVAVQLLAASAIGCPAISHRRAALAGEPAEAMYPLRNSADKDLDLVMGLAARVGAPMPQTEQVAELVEAAILAGHGDDDLAVGLVGYLRRRTIPAGEAVVDQAITPAG